MRRATLSADSPRELSDQAIATSGTEPLGALAHALEIDWENAAAQDSADGGKWPMGLTIWFCIAASAGLWGAIACAIRFI